MFDFFCCAAFLPDSSACYENKNVSLYKNSKRIWIHSKKKYLNGKYYPYYLQWGYLVIVRASKRLHGRKQLECVIQVLLDPNILDIRNSSFIIYPYHCPKYKVHLAHHENTKQTGFNKYQVIQQCVVLPA